MVMMMRSKQIYYAEVFGKGCCLTTETKAQLIKREGTENVERFRPATKQDIAWVKAMGGYVPDTNPCLTD